MTDEQLVAYFDTSQRRIRDDAAARFAAMVEAVRVGTIFVHEPKQHRSWRDRMDRRSGHADGKSIAQLAKDFGGSGRIVRGEFEFRN